MMKKKQKVPIKKILLTMLLLQFMSVIIFFISKDFILSVIPYLGFIVLPLAGFFMWRQRKNTWQVLREKATQPLKYALGLMVIFSLYALFYWQLGALSLTLSLPNLIDAQGTMVYMQVAPKALLQACMQLALSMWLLASCLALGRNAMETEVSRAPMLNWFSQQITLIASMSACYLLTFLMALQCSKSVATAMGITQVTVPYTGLFVFFLVMYAFHLLYHFGKHHRQAARNPKHGLSYLFGRQFGFFVLAWWMSIIALYCLPTDFISQLSVSLGVPLVSPENYAHLWLMTIAMWGLCCVPLLSKLIARLSSRLAVLPSALLILVLPLAIYSVVLSGMHYSGSLTQFFLFNVPYAFSSINEEALIFQSSFLSVTAGSSALLLWLSFKYCPDLSRAWVTLMPRNTGRRLLHLKVLMSRLFPLCLMLLVSYLLMGLVPVAALFTGYLLGILLYFILQLGHGLAVSVSPLNTPIQWKGEVVS